MPRRIFIDTWGWFAYLDKRDAAHKRVKPYLDHLLREGTACCTSDPVLIECLDRARQEDLDLACRLADWFAKSVGRGEVQVLQMDPEARKDALLLRLQYRSDSRITFVDCANAALMARNEVPEILSADQHYRQLCEGIRLLPEDDAGSDS